VPTVRRPVRLLSCADNRFPAEAWRSRSEREVYVGVQAIGSRYGALPGHDGLWESAAATAHSLPTRLAVEHWSQSSDPPR
jgi:Protein of unknown function (DUF455)